MGGGGQTPLRGKRGGGGEEDGDTATPDSFYCTPTIQQSTMTLWINFEYTTGLLCLIRKSGTHRKLNPAAALALHEQS